MGVQGYDDMWGTTAKPVMLLRRATDLDIETNKGQPGIKAVGSPSTVTANPDSKTA